MMQILSLSKIPGNYFQTAKPTNIIRQIHNQLGRGNNQLCSTIKKNLKSSLFINKKQKHYQIWNSKFRITIGNN